MKPLLNFVRRIAYPEQHIWTYVAWKRGDYITLVILAVAVAAAFALWPL